MSSAVWGNPGDNTDFIMVGFGFLALEPLASYVGQLLTLIGGKVFAFNFLTFVSFPLAGTTMYLLANYVPRRLTLKVKSANTFKVVLGEHGRLPKLLTSLRQISPAAFLAGIIFAFCPYHFWQSYDHFTLGQIQWLPLFFLAFLIFLEKPSPKRGLWLGLAWALNFLTNLHYGYFTILLAGAYLFSKAILNVGRRFPHPSGICSFTRRVFLAGLPALAIAALAITLWYLRTKIVGSDILEPDFARPLDDVFALSARPWDYLIPAPNHLLLGNWGQEILHKIWSIKENYRYASPFLPERVIYLGIVPLVLAAYSILAKDHRSWVMDYRKKSKIISSTIHHLPSIISLTALLLVLLSLPPFFDFSFGRIHFPNFLLYKIFPFVRVYARLGIVVSMLVALLAAIGIANLNSKKRAVLKFKVGIGNWSWLLVLGIIILVLFEFLPGPHPFCAP
jgi:hypothetical protein